jgi:peptidoglycan/LPS O-acetylase OafA/YrhL
VTTAGSGSSPLHFKGLNGLRAIAALIVVVFHVDMHMWWVGLEPQGFHRTGMAEYAVTLFFVLSGFLITRLLLEEKARFGRIDLGKFYVRRILRIWPVHYLVVAVAAVLVLAGFISWPGSMPATFAFYSLLLANVGYAVGLRLPLIAPLWSVSVEEQFYAVWPLLVARSRNLARALVILIAGYLALKFALRFLENGVLCTLVRISSFDSMAIGGLGAVLVTRQDPRLRVVYHPVVQAGAWAFLVWSVLVRPVHVASLLDGEVHSLVYAVLVVNVSCNPRTLVALEQRWLDRLGRISYGLYAYHMTVIFLLARGLRGWIPGAVDLPGPRLLVQLLCVGTSVLIAQVSYMWFERPLLAWKGRFSRVTTVS